MLRRPLGGWEVHRDQLEHLLELGRLLKAELQMMPSERSEHAGVGGPFVMLPPKGKPQVGYTEAQSNSHLITDPEEVRMFAARYGSIRARALTVQEALVLNETLLGERCTAEPKPRAWFKSSYSGNEGGECLEVMTAPGTIHIRDSKAPPVPNWPSAPRSGPRS